MASSTTLISFLPLLFSLSVLFSLLAPSFSSPTEKLTPEILKRVCSGGGESKCLQTLQHDPQTQTLNLPDLTLSYIDKSQNRASNTLRLLETLIGQTLNPILLYKYRHCWKHYKVVVWDLSHAKRRLLSRKLDEIGGFVNTASSRVANCDDEFEDRKFVKPAELDRSNEEIEIFGKIVFGLATELNN